MRRGLALALGVGTLAGAAFPAGAAADDPFVLSWGRSGEGIGRFERLTGVGAGGPYVFAADARSNTIQKFTAQGAFVRAFGAAPAGKDPTERPDAISGPEGVAVGRDGRVYVVEQAGRTRVSRWSSTGRFLGAFADGGELDGQLSSPRQVALDPAGNVYVADRGNQRIEKFSPSGTYLASIGKGDGEFVSDDKLSSPVGVAIGPDGTIYAVDDLYRRVQRYAPDGRFLGSFGSYGSEPGQFAGPSAVAVTSAGAVYVADGSGSSVQRFTADGRFVARVGTTPGTAPGQFSDPRYLTVDCRGSLFVADGDNHRVQRFGAANRDPCGRPATDPAERLHVGLRASSPQRFGQRFGIAAGVRCDQVCALRLNGSVRGAGRGTLRLRTLRTALAPGSARTYVVVLGERDTDRVLAALRRGRRVTATVTASATGTLGHRARVGRRVRLRP